jgi:hypothetical protein
MMRRPTKIMAYVKGERSEPDTGQLHNQITHTLLSLPQGRSHMLGNDSDLTRTWF